MTLDPTGQDEAEPTDYSDLTSITIKAGQTTGTGTVATNQDEDIDDENLYAQIDLSGLGEAVEHDGLYTFYVKIVDDDKPPPTVWFDDGFGNILPNDEGEGFRGVLIHAGNPFKPYPEFPYTLN